MLRVSQCDLRAHLNNRWRSQVEETDKRSQLVDIPEAECRELLAGHKLGRLAILVEGQPQIFPINYAMNDQVIVLRTGPGTKLRFAPMSKVAFEIDEYDPATRGGWSVMVQGLAHEVTGALDRTSRQLASCR
jgi:uncharacterized protein